MMRNKISTRYGTGFVLLVLVCSAAVSMPVWAAGSISGSVSVANDYIFRGLSQTNQQPALQAGLEYAGRGGWYVGTWGSNISWLSDGSTSMAPISSSLEIDVYAGYRHALTQGISVDLGVYTYDYPGSYPRGFTRPNSTEGYIGIGAWGLSLKYSHAFTNLFGVADSKSSDYWDLSYSHALNNVWTATAHVGHQQVENNPDASYSDWNISISDDFGRGFSGSLGYYDSNADRAVYTNAPGHYLGRATLLAILSKSF